MNKRTKILATAFSIVIAYAMISSVVYPRWIKPLVTIDVRIAQQQKKLDELNELEDKVNQARFDYKTLVNRIGTFDPAKLQNHARVQLNTLIEKHKLQNAKVTPSRVSEDRKTDIKSMMITITATGPLQSAISFMQDVAQLPYLLRMGNVALYPSGSSRSRKPQDILNIRIPMELLVLPKQRIVGAIDEKELKRPDMVVRHEGHDYSPIWLNTPFLEFIPPVPLIVLAGPDINMKMGQRKTPTPTISGGEKPYKFSWSPTEKLSDPTDPRPMIDSSVPFDQAITYTLTIIDAEGVTGSDSLTVMVEDRDPENKPDPTPPTPPRNTRWPDGRTRTIVMTLMNWTEDERTEELMVYDQRRKSTEYFRPGSEFDGGELVFVHQTGGLVRRDREYYVYPIGNTANEDLTIDKAAEYPELRKAYEHFKLTDIQNDKSPAGNEKNTQAIVEPAKAGSTVVDSKPHNSAPTSLKTNPEAGKNQKTATPSNNERTTPTPRRSTPTRRRTTPPKKPTQAKP